MAGAGSVSVFARMDVTVINLLLGGLTDINDFDIELEVDPGKGVVGIDGDLVAVDRGDLGDTRAAWGLGLKAHSGFEFDILGKLAAGGINNEVLTPFTVALDSGDIGGEALAGGLALKLFFETGDDVSVSVEVGQGFLVPA